MARIGRCSVCGNMPSTAVEAVEMATEFTIKTDGTLVDEGVHGYGRGTLSLTVHCDCGHEWRLPMKKALALLLEKTGNEAR